MWTVTVGATVVYALLGAVGMGMWLTNRPVRGRGIGQKIWSAKDRVEGLLMECRRACLDNIPGLGMIGICRDGGQLCISRLSSRLMFIESHTQYCSFAFFLQMRANGIRTCESPRPHFPRFSHAAFRCFSLGEHQHLNQMSSRIEMRPRASRFTSSFIHLNHGKP